MGTVSSERRLTLRLEADSVGDSWLYYKLFLGDRFWAAEHLIANVLARVAESAEDKGWFFLRYTDEGGPHLRFRLRCGQESNDDLDLLVRPMLVDALEGLAGAAPSRYRPLVRHGSIAPAIRMNLSRRVERADYIPEVEKFGVRGIRVAEKLFEASSVLAAQIIASCRDNRFSRKNLLPLYMEIVLRWFPVAAPGFWTRYADHWLAVDGSRATDWRPRFEVKVRALQAEGWKPPRAEDLSLEEQQLCERWDEALRRAADGYSQLPDSPPVPNEVLAPTFMHLMNNRLGLSPLEEAYLATLLGSIAAEARA